METPSRNPLMFTIFGVVFVALVIAAAARLGRTAHDDIEDRQGERFGADYPIDLPRPSQ